jgi:choline-glycine betaine transporter
MQKFLQFIILTFIYSSTYFGRPYAHNQEPNNWSSSLWCYLRNVVIAVLLLVVRPAGPTTYTFISVIPYAVYNLFFILPPPKSRIKSTG